MKLKDRNQNKRERRPETSDAHFAPQEDRILRTTLLAIVIFGAAALAWVVLYLFDLNWTPGGLNWHPKGSRFWLGE
ncbi:hypothetical protein [Microvirga lotononidis]|uniref:Uncharacterized protein n=1 Tax=Microvirga lotononidis TaxID=864069 RepID=I4YPW3_9HYPH|nr:hypothetical protein [Microvirga lotononidis]EIM26005.1 hypothetical protein MicloDRAFT_00067350 [Microvirga lotononidis]WQO25914.1 hypothetical protein U0023_14485 [Microvirga lotononidis]